MIADSAPPPFPHSPPPPFHPLLILGFTLIKYEWAKFAMKTKSLGILINNKKSYSELPLPVMEILRANYCPSKIKQTDRPDRKFHLLSCDKQGRKAKTAASLRHVLSRPLVSYAFTIFHVQSCECITTPRVESSACKLCIHNLSRPKLRPETGITSSDRSRVQHEKNFESCNNIFFSSRQ